MFRKLFTVMLLLIVFVGCQKVDEPSTNDQVDVDIDTNFIDAQNSFGFNLFQQLAAEDDDNIFLSPTSVFVALAMLYNGADGVTKDEIAEVLQIETIDLAELNTASANLLNVLNQETDEITVQLANSLWINEEFEFQDEYVESLTNYFQAMVEQIDISDDVSIEKINQWVDAATNGLIDEMVDSLPPNLVAIILNAIYLDANWTIPFDENQTVEKPFYPTEDSEKTVPLMTLNDELFYMENDDFQAVQLMYGDDAEMGMTVILPEVDSSPDEIIADLNLKNWSNWQDKFAEQEGTLLLPKFTLEYEVNLNDPLIHLGMGSAFDERADLSNLIKDAENLAVSEVKHKSFLDINEEGTEAAAATSVEIVEMSAIDGPEPFYMEVNRPFIIAITDHQTNALLFLGAIKDPA